MVGTDVYPEPAEEILIAFITPVDTVTVAVAPDPDPPPVKLTVGAEV
jgi:hypothetical protein